MNVHVPDAVLWGLVGIAAFFVGRYLLGVVLMLLWDLAQHNWSYGREQRKARRAKRRAERRAVRDLD